MEVGSLELMMELLQLCFIIIVPFVALYGVFRLLLFVFEGINYSFLQSCCIIAATVFLSFNPLIFGMDLSIIPLFSFHNWEIMLHSCGLVLPLLLCVLCLKKGHISWSQLVFGIFAVSLGAFFVTIPIPEKGIVSMFPFFLFPAFIAAVVAFLWMDDGSDIKDAMVFSYVASIFGVFIGADLLHLPTLLVSDVGVPMQAVIGGAAAFDLIYLSGVVSILFFYILYMFSTFVDGLDIKGKQLHMHLHH